MMVAAVILFITALLLACPICVQAALFDGEARLTVRYLFLRFSFPRPEKEEKTEKPEADGKPGKRKKKKKAVPEEEPQKGWNAQRVLDVISLARQALSLLGRAGGRFLRGLRVRALKLEVMVVRDNAHETAVMSGKLNAAACCALALIQNFAKIDELYLNIYPGYWATQDTVAFEGSWSFRPARVLWAASTLLFGGIPLLLKAVKVLKGAPDEPEERAEENNDEPEDSQREEAAV